MIITVAPSVASKAWKAKTVSWGELVSMLSRVNRTSETMAEYKAMSKEDKGRVKDIGGFVGGRLTGKRRVKGAVLNRCLVIQIASQLGVSVVAAIPYAWLATKAGAAAVGSASLGIGELLPASALTGYSGVAGMLELTKKTLVGMAENPQFWATYLQVTGDSYMDAIEAGTPVDKAMMYSTVNGLVNAALEIGGGIQTLPTEFQEIAEEITLRGILPKVAESSVEEGMEEVWQGFYERGIGYLLDVQYQSGGETKSGRDRSLISLEDREAVISVFGALDEFAGGYVVGMVLGGAQSIRSFIDAKGVAAYAENVNKVIMTMPEDVRPAMLDEKAATREEVDNKLAEILAVSLRDRMAENGGNLQYASREQVKNGLYTAEQAANQNQKILSDIGEELVNANFNSNNHNLSTQSDILTRIFGGEEITKYDIEQLAVDDPAVLSVFRAHFGEDARIEQMADDPGVKTTLCRAANMAAKKTGTVRSEINSTARQLLKMKTEQVGRESAQIKAKATAAATAQQTAEAQEINPKVEAETKLRQYLSESMSNSRARDVYAEIEADPNMREVFHAYLKQNGMGIPTKDSGRAAVQELSKKFKMNAFAATRSAAKVVDRNASISVSGKTQEEVRDIIAKQSGVENIPTLGEFYAQATELLEANKEGITDEPETNSVILGLYEETLQELGLTSAEIDAMMAQSFVKEARLAADIFTGRKTESDVTKIENKARLAKHDISGKTEAEVRAQIIEDSGLREDAVPLFSEYYAKAIANTDGSAQAQANIASEYGRTLRGKGLSQAEVDALVGAAQVKSSKTTGQKILRKVSKPANIQLDGFKEGRLINETGIDLVIGRGSTLNRQQQISLRIIDFISKAVGGKIHFYASVVKDGRRVFATDMAGYKAGTAAANGFFDHATGDVYIDIFAGNIGRGTMLYTLAHEYVHQIATNSEADYKILRDFISEKLGQEKMETLMREAEATAKRNKRNELSPEQLEEEVVADAMQKIFMNPATMKELAGLQDVSPTLADKLYELANRFVEQLDAAYAALEKADLSHAAKEMQELKLTRDELDGLAKAFVRGVKAERKSGAETERSMSDRMVDDDGKKKYTKRKRSSYSETETLFLQWENGSAPAGEVKKFIRFGKNKYYEKTDIGCIELTPAQYAEKRRSTLYDDVARANSEANETVISDEIVTGGSNRNNSRDRNGGRNEVLSRHSIGEELRHDDGRTAGSRGGDSFRISDLTEQNETESYTADQQTGESVSLSDRVSPEMDAEYLELAKEPEKNRERLQRIVSSYAVQNGAAVDNRGNALTLYHGSPAFGFTTFSRDTGTASTGLIFTTTKREVAANYGRHGDYAFTRDIGKPFMPGDSVEATVNNAEKVLGLKIHPISAEERKSITAKAIHDAQVLSDKVDNYYDRIQALPGFQGGEEYYDSPAAYFDGVMDVFYTALGEYEYNADGTLNPTDLSYFSSAEASFDRNYPKLKEYLVGIYDQVRGTPLEEARNFLSGFDIIDTAAPILSSMKNAITGDEVIFTDGDRTWKKSVLDNLILQSKDSAAYRLYGFLGSNPLYVDAAGLDWLTLKVPEIDDKYHSTDYVGHWAIDNGYTALVVKNVYDGGDIADDYIFFNPEQVKSADPVTYDNNRNVIPLSQRFNPEEDDIRFSDRTDIQNDIYYPTNARERSAFLRSFANKTSGILPGEVKNIIVNTADKVYFIKAAGYLQGKIDDVIDTPDGHNDKSVRIIREFIYGQRSDAVRENSSLRSEYPRSRDGRDVWDPYGVEDPGTEGRPNGLDEEQSESDTVGYYWEDIGYSSWDEVVEAVVSGALIPDENGDTIVFDPVFVEEKKKELGFSHSDRTEVELQDSIHPEHPEVTVGLNFRDPSGVLLDRVFSTDEEVRKKYETRPYKPDTRGQGQIKSAYLNRLVGIIQTGGGQAKLVGYWKLGDGEVKDAQWLNDHAAELGNDGTEFQAKDGESRWVYPIEYVERIDDTIDVSRDVHSFGPQARALFSDRAEVEPTEAQQSLIQDMRDKYGNDIPEEHLLEMGLREQEKAEDAAAVADAVEKIDETLTKVERIINKPKRDARNEKLRAALKASKQETKRAEQFGKGLVQSREYFARQEERAKAKRQVKQATEEERRSFNDALFKHDLASYDPTRSAGAAAAEVKRNQDKALRNAEAWGRGLAASREKYARKEERRIADQRVAEEKRKTKQAEQFGRGITESRVKEERRKARQRELYARQDQRTIDRDNAKEAASLLNSRRKQTAPDTSNSAIMYTVRNGKKKLTMNEWFHEQGGKLKNAGQSIYRALWSAAAPIERIAKLQPMGERADTLINILGAARDTVTVSYEDGLVSMNGDIMDKALKDMFPLGTDEESKQKLEVLDHYMTLMTTIDCMSIEERARQARDDYEATYPFLTQMTPGELAREVGKGNEIIDRYVQLLRMADSRHGVKNKTVLVDDAGNPVSAETARAAVDELVAAQPWVVDVAQEIYDYWDRFMREWVVGKKMSEADYEDMRQAQPHYMPHFRDFGDGAKGSAAINTQGKNMSASAATRAMEGSKRPLLPVEDEFRIQMDRQIRGARSNELLANLIRTAMFDTDGTFSDYLAFDWESADNATKQNFWDYMEDADAEQETDGMEDLKDGRYRISAYVDGVKMSAYVSKDVFSALNFVMGKKSGSVGERVYDVLVKTGRFFTNPMKRFITGINPIFALRNVTRDYNTANINSIAGLGFSKYLAQAYGQILGMSDDAQWKQFKALGGSHADYYNYESGFREGVNRRPTLSGVVDNTIGAFNEVTESATRFAEYLATIDMYGDSYETRLLGIKNSAEVTVDFSRKGTMGSLINAWVPYWNPAMQGIDKMIRQVANAEGIKGKMKVLGRAACMNVLPEILLYAALSALGRLDDWREFNDRMRDTYYLIPVGEHEFLKIPKSRDWGAILGTPVMRILDGIDGRDDPFENYLETSFFANFVPPNPLTDNIIVGNKMDLDANEDFAGRRIVPYEYQDKSPSLQWNGDTSLPAYLIAQGYNATPELLREFVSEYSQLLGKEMSPMQADYVLQNYFGDFAGMLFEFMPMSLFVDDDGFWAVEQDALSNAWETTKTKFIGNNQYSNYTSGKYYETLDALEQEINDYAGEDAKESIAYKTKQALTSGKNSYGKRISEIGKQISTTTDEEEKDALKAEQLILMQDALDFYDRCMSGEIEEPQLYVKYEKYGSVVRDGLIAEKDYFDDYSFEPQSTPQNPKKIDVNDLEYYDLSALDDDTAAEYKAKYGELYDAAYKKTMTAVMNSSAYRNATGKRRAELLEDAVSDVSKEARAQFSGWVKEQRLPVAVKDEYKAYPAELRTVLINISEEPWEAKYTYKPKLSVSNSYVDPDNKSNEYILTNEQKQYYLKLSTDAYLAEWEKLQRQPSFLSASTKKQAEMLDDARSKADKAAKNAFFAWLKLNSKSVPRWGGE